MASPASSQWTDQGEARWRADQKAIMAAVQQKMLGGSMVMTIEPALKIGVAG